MNVMRYTLPEHVHVDHNCWKEISSWRFDFNDDDFLAFVYATSKAVADLLALTLFVLASPLLNGSVLLKCLLSLESDRKTDASVTLND